MNYIYCYETSLLSRISLELSAKGNCSFTSRQSEPKTDHESTTIHASQKKFTGLGHFQTQIIKAKVI